MYWDEGHESPRWPMLVASAAVGALVVGLIWFVQARMTEEELGEPPSGSAGTGAREEDPEPDRLARCQEVFRAQTEPLRAAEKSLAQWEVHVGAMNKLVTGAITLKQATEFWDETRISAADLLKRHASAVEEFGQRTARCPRTVPGTTTAAVAQCTATVTARGTALYEASVAEATWREHVHHMEMLRNGEMSPDDATQLWLMSWRQGVRELRAYHNAARAAVAPTCDSS
jgi:hypothetical protein